MISVDFWRNRLGRRIVALMILVSAVLSIGAAAAQLFLAYLSDRDRVLSEFTVIEDSFRSGLENALWEFDFKQVEVLLGGILAQHDIVGLTLKTPDNRIWELGAFGNSDLVFREFDLTYTGRDDRAVPVGHLTAGLSLEFVRARVWDQLLALLLSNFLKTMLASIAMLAIFDRLAARHLRKIADQAQSDWLENSELVTIQRRPPAEPDELDEIVGSLNHARTEIRDAHMQLSQKLVELGAVNGRLSDANREQAEFTYAISHDLKSPANTVRMLLRELKIVASDQMDETGQDILDDMTVTVDRMGQLVDDVLAYARSVGEDMTLETVDLGVEVDKILQDLSGDISEAGAEITVRKLPVLQGNQMQLRLLMQNLISNAVKFRDPDRPLVVHVESENDRLLGVKKIRVKDNGIGIEAKHHKDVFGLFKRLHTHQVYPGTGIGLTVCQRIVSNHGGKIDVSSQSGVGSTFTISLPEDLDG